MGISPITFIKNMEPVNLVKKPLLKLANCKQMDKLCKHYDSAKVVAGVGMASILLKDGLGCYLYVKQSLNNEKIPSDKRKFVAALDLTNGGLMILTQLLMFKTISDSKFQAKVFKKLFGKTFGRPVKKGYQALIKATNKLQNVTGKEFTLSFAKFEKELQKTFGVLSSLIAATIIAKRVIVPFIATPLADKAKAWMCRNDKPETVHPETKNQFSTSTVKPNAPKQPETNIIKRYIET